MEEGHCNFLCFYRKNNVYAVQLISKLASDVAPASNSEDLKILNSEKKLKDKSMTDL